MSEHKTAVKQLGLNSFCACTYNSRFILVISFQGSMSVAEISEQLNLTSIKDHGWHIQVEYHIIL